MMKSLARKSPSSLFEKKNLEPQYVKRGERKKGWFFANLQQAKEIQGEIDFTIGRPLQEV